jgi:hypothetical protein
MMERPHWEEPEDNRAEESGPARLDRPEAFFERSRFVPTTRLYRYAAWLGLAQAGPPESSTVERELGRAALLLSVVAVFDYTAWVLLLRQMVATSVGLFWVPFLFAALLTTATIIFEFRILTMRSTSNPLIYLARIFLISVAAAATSQPVELLMFGGAIDRRVHEESVVRFALDVHQRLLFDEADQRSRSEAAKRAVRDAMASKFGDGDGSGGFVGGLGGLAVSNLQQARSSRLSAERLLVQATELRSYAPGTHKGCPVETSSACKGRRPASVTEAAAIGSSCERTYRAAQASWDGNRVEDQLLTKLHDKWGAYVSAACSLPGSPEAEAGQCAAAQEIAEATGPTGELRGRGACNRGTYNRLLDRSHTTAGGAAVQFGAIIAQASSEESKVKAEIGVMEGSAQTEGKERQATLEQEAARIATTIAAMKQVIPTLLRSKPATYTICAPHGELVRWPLGCGDRGKLAGISADYEVMSYDFMEQRRVMGDLREGRPPRWPVMGDDAVARLRAFGMAKEYYASKDYREAAMRDATEFEFTYWLVFAGALFIPFIVLVYKANMPPALQRYFEREAGDG